MTSPDAAITEHLKELERITPIPLRFPTMERVCAPSSGRLWVIGGMPGSFKTGLVWNMAVNAAQLGRRVLMVALEVTPGELALNGLARFSGLAVRRIQSAFASEGRLPFSPMEQERFDRAREDMKVLDMRLRLHGAATHGRSIRSVLASATRHRYDAVFLDHAGMLAREGPSRDELNILSEGIDKLRALTDGEIQKDYRPFVCVTTHLRRDDRGKKGGKDDDRRPPGMGDFRGTSRFEGDSDAAIILEKRATVAENEKDNPIALVEAFVVKNRHGPHPYVIQLVANGETTRVAERLPKKLAEASETQALPLAPPPADDPDLSPEPPSGPPEPGWDG